MPTKGKFYQRIGSFLTALVLTISGTSIAWPVFFSEKANAYSSSANFIQSTISSANIELGTYVAFDIYVTKHDNASHPAVKLGALAGSLTANATNGKVASTISSCDAVDWSTATSSSTAVINGKSHAIAKFCYKPSNVGSFSIDFTGSFPYNWGFVHGIETPKSKTVSVNVSDTIAPVAPNGGVATISNGNDVRFTWNPIVDTGTPVYYVVQIDGGAEIGLPVGVNMMDVNDMADGDHVWHVKSVDAGGLISDYSELWTFKIDVSAPQITLKGNPIENIEVGNTYDDAGATALDDIDGDLTSSIAVSGEVIDTSTVGGPYTVQYKVSDSNGNDAYASRIVNVVPRKITVTVEGKTKEYGAVDSELSFLVTSGSLLPSDTNSDLGIILVRALGEDVASYPISRESSTLNSNYEITFDYTSAFYEVTKRPITVTADAKSKVFGTIDPSLTYQVTSGSIVAVDNDVFTGSLSRAVGESVGIYEIGQGTLLLNDNYELTFIPASFGITAAPVIVPVEEPVIPQVPVVPPVVEIPVAAVTAVAAVDVTPEVLGTATEEAAATSDIASATGSTDVKSDDPEVKSATDKKDSGWDIMGLAWYWWLIIVALAASIWWFIAARRRTEEDQKPKTVKSGKK